MEKNLSSFNDAKLDKVMTSEQFNEIVEAILSGKYSWACVLILRFAGYNPLHYIPYRTYNRLMKDNGMKSLIKERINKRRYEELSTHDNSLRVRRKPKVNITTTLSDLSYLEDLGGASENSKSSSKD